MFFNTFYQINCLQNCKYLKNNKLTKKWSLWNENNSNVTKSILIALFSSVCPSMEPTFTHQFIYLDKIKIETSSYLSFFPNTEKCTYRLG